MANGQPQPQDPMGFLPAWLEPRTWLKQRYKHLDPEKDFGPLYEWRVPLGLTTPGEQSKAAMLDLAMQEHQQEVTQYRKPLLEQAAKLAPLLGIPLTELLGSSAGQGIQPTPEQLRTVVRPLDLPGYEQETQTGFMSPPLQVPGEVIQGPPSIIPMEPNLTGNTYAFRYPTAPFQELDPEARPTTLQALQAQTALEPSVVAAREKMRFEATQPSPAQSPVGKIIADLHRMPEGSVEQYTMRRALDQELFKGLDVGQAIKDKLVGQGITQPTPQHIAQAEAAVRADKLADHLAEARGKAKIGLGTETLQQQVFSMYGISNMEEATKEQVDKAIDALYRRELQKSREQGAAQLAEHPVEPGERDVIAGLNEMIRVAKAIQTEFTPEERARYAGLVNLPTERIKTLLKGAQADPKFVRFYALLKEQGLAAFGIAGKQLTGIEKETIFGFIPTGTEWSPVEFEAKLKTAVEHGQFQLDQRIIMATTPRKNIRQELQKNLERDTQQRKAKAQRFEQLRKQGKTDEEAFQIMLREGF